MTNSVFWGNGGNMSRSERARIRNKRIPADDYFTNGVFEVARFGKDVILRNNRTPEQQLEHMEYLETQYAVQYEALLRKIREFHSSVLQCDPFKLLRHIRSISLMTQCNAFQSNDGVNEANSLVICQEYVQSIFISNPLQATISTIDEEESYNQIINDFEDIYSEVMIYYHYLAAHLQKKNGLTDQELAEIMESQYMYWVRGNRFQVYELEPIKELLPPHNAVLMELFGVTAQDIVSGLEKLRYSLSQGYADALMDFVKEFDVFTKAVDEGLTPEEAYANAQVRTDSIVGKVFGSDLIDVKAITHWDDRFIDELSANVYEETVFGNESEFEGWPIIAMPVARKPFIRINDTTYAFLYYALFDNVYRIIQKAIIRKKPDYAKYWKDNQTVASERMVGEVFKKLLPGADVYIGNYYPVKNSLKQMNENDIIIVYHNYLFIIEVKAGSFPTTAPITDFDAHISAYKNLAEVADTQCSRTLDYIKGKECAQFYNHEKTATFKVSKFEDYDDVFTFSVTVENFNAFAAKAEKSSIITLREKTIVISYDDLLVYAGYFDSPICFLHFLKQRKAAMQVPQFQMNDEFDHLGLYIEKNLYAHNTSQYNDINKVFWNGFRQSINEYFNWLYTEPARAKKPTQTIPRRIKDIIAYLDRTVTGTGIQLAHFILNLSSDARAELCNQIDYIIKRQGDIKRQVPIVAFGEIKYCLFVSIPGISLYSCKEKLDYAYSAATRNDSIPVELISLEYDKGLNLVSVEGKRCCITDLDEEEKIRITAVGNENAKTG